MKLRILPSLFRRNLNDGVLTLVEYNPLEGKYKDIPANLTITGNPYFLSLYIFVSIENEEGGVGIYSTNLRTLEKVQVSFLEGVKQAPDSPVHTPDNLVFFSVSEVLNVAPAERLYELSYTDQRKRSEIELNDTGITLGLEVRGTQLNKFSKGDSHYLVLSVGSTSTVYYRKGKEKYRNFLPERSISLIALMESKNPHSDILLLVIQSNLPCWFEISGGRLHNIFPCWELRSLAGRINSYSISHEFVAIEKEQEFNIWKYQEEAECSTLIKTYQSNEGIKYGINLSRGYFLAFGTTRVDDRGAVTSDLSAALSNEESKQKEFGVWHAETGLITFLEPFYGSYQIYKVPCCLRRLVFYFDSIFPLNSELLQEVLEFL